MKKWIFSLALTVVASASLAIPEKNFSSNYDEKVKPFVQAGEVLSFKGIDNIAIKFARFGEVGELGPIIISPGRTETYLHYAELSYDLHTKGFGPIYIVDHRGQGFSERMLKDSQKGHVNKFSNYVEDFSRFVELVQGDLVALGIEKRPSLIAHSMGGAIALGYVMSSDRAFEKVVLLSPMLGIDFKLIGIEMDSALRGLSSLLCLSESRCNDYAPTQEKYDPKRVFKKNNKITSSKERWLLTRKKIYKENPGTALGGITNSWFLESLRACDQLLNSGTKLNTPTLLLQAEKEKVVSNEAQVEFCSRVESCRLGIVRGARHAIHNESDKIRNEALDQIIGFLID